METTITIPLYSFPVPDSPLDKAILYCGRTSNFPFTGKVFVPREHLNALEEAIYEMHREIERLKADKEGNGDEHKM